MFPFESVSEEIKENGFCQQKQDFLKYWSPSNGFKENMNERISFQLNRKSVATGCSKGYFPWYGKSASSRRDICGIGRKWFPLAGKSVSTNQNKGFLVKINLH